jgi:hypothetical protein
MTSHPVRTSPPAWLARLAAAVIPPDAREHVIGDLCERYRSPRLFIADVLRTLPFALATRIRRTSVIGMWPFLAAMMIGFLGAGPGLRVWARGFAPTVALLVGYMFRDAYRIANPGRRWRQGVLDAAVVAVFVSASQAVVAWLAPSLVMTRAGALGCVVILAILTALRAMNPARNGASIPHCSGAVSLRDLQEEVTWYQNAARRGGRLEIAACFVLLPILAAGGILLPQPLQRFASTVTFVSVAYVAWYV